MTEYTRSDDLGELFTALAKAQGAMSSAPREGKNPHFRSRYSTLEAVVEASREPLAENGLSITQFPTNAAADDISVTTLLGHSSGQWLASTLRVKPLVYNAQGIGSVITYLRRYARLSILGIAPEDDDGEAAVGRPDPERMRPLPRTQPVSLADPETGEIGPHPLTVPVTDGNPNWIGWGGQLVAALSASQTRDEAEAWLRECEPELRQCEARSPKVFERLTAQITAMRERLPEAELMEA
jgi:hypothetical protein